MSINANPPFLLFSHATKKLSLPLPQKSASRNSSINGGDVFTKFWTPERRNELLLLMDEKPRTLDDFQIAKHFKKSRRECYIVYNALKREGVFSKKTYVDENGITVVVYQKAYAQGVTPQVSARAKEKV